MTRLRIAAALRWLALAGIYALAILALRTAHAQPRADAALALGVAMVAANEASLSTIRPADVGLIWQVTETHGDDSRSRLRWLRSHSSCVLGRLSDEEAAARPGNCVWTRNLRDSDARPDGWPAHLRWSRYVARWRQVRAIARRLVSGRLVMRPCSRAPLTWGSRLLDLDGAIRRGLRPLECRDPQTGERLGNDGFERAGDAS